MVSRFVFSGAADSFHVKYCSSVTGTKREAILFLSSGESGARISGAEWETNQIARKALSGDRVLHCIVHFPRALWFSLSPESTQRASGDS